MPRTCWPIARCPLRGLSRSKATAVLMMGTGSTGARDKADIPTSVQDWPGCSNSNMDAVVAVGCSSNMTTGLRWTISMGTTAIRALRTCKRCMDIATMRKRGSTETISRQVCVPSIRILRSGVRRKSHAPFWSSGRRSDPPIDCNRINLDIRQHVAAVGRWVNTLCKHEAGIRQQLVLYHVYHNEIFEVSQWFDQCDLPRFERSGSTVLLGGLMALTKKGGLDVRALAQPVAFTLAWQVPWCLCAQTALDEVAWGEASSSGAKLS